MFRTEIPLTPLPHQLPPSARVLTLGSCFSDAIGARLTEFKVATLVNPFGTVFNPISACKLLRAAAGEDVDWQQHLVEARGRWQSYDLHAEIGADSPVELLQHISQLTREVGVFLATADVVVLTLGSAFAYRLRETGELVSNCHKVGADQFYKELLTADEIIAAVAETHAYLRRVNPKLRFVLTVSPVRHLKDTLVLNSASKAMLRVACHYLSELLPDVTYFPAYELLVDDLRDYRFYATDMLHLSETAENYVWDKFTRTYFDAAFGRFKKEWEGIRQNLSHRPLHPAAPEHRAFLESTLERLRKLGGTADVRMELLHVERELANLPEPKAAAPASEEVYDDGEERIDIGSFDDQAVTSKVQPAAAPAVAAATEADTKPEATKKGAAKKEINRAVFAKTRLTSQASLIRPGAGLLVEDAEETELEETDTTEATDSAASAYDHAYSPTITDLTDEVETDEDEADESEELGEPETAEEVARRKKRRSRGGAKRTKRKHARLAAEQGNIEGQTEVSAVTTAPALLPDAPLPGSPVTIVQPDDKEEPASEVVYITEAQLRQPRPQPTPLASSPTEPTSTDDTETAIPEADETAPEARRNRNNRRGNKREQAPRYGGRPGRQPLYALDTNGPAPMPADTVPEATPAPTEGNTTEPMVPNPVVPASADPSEKPVARQRAPKPKATRQPAAALATPAEPASVEATPAVTAPAEAAPVATAAPATPEPAAAKPTARPSRRKPAAQPKEAPVAMEEVAAAPEPVKAPARKRAAAKPKAPAAPDAAVAPQAAAVATESAPPKPAAPAKPVAKPKAPAKAKPKATAEATTKKTTKAAAKPEAAADKAATVLKPAVAKSTPAKPKPAARSTKKDKPEKPEA